MPITPADVEERHIYTTRIWRDRGLTGEKSDGDLWRGLNYYRGLQDCPYTGDGDSEKFVTSNLIFRSANTIDAQIAARAPKVLLFPRNRDAILHRGAAQSLYNYFVREQDMKKEANQARRDSDFAPFGIVRHGYTPRAEYFATRTSGQTPKPIAQPDSHKPDIPWLKRIPIWDFRCDLTAGDCSPGVARWASFRSLLHMDDIKRNPNMVNGQNVQPTTSVDATREVDRYGGETDSGVQSADFLKMVEVWTYWDRIERQWLQWSPGLPGKFLRQPDDWPIPWDEMPYDLMFVNPQGDDPFPVPVMSQVVPQQEEMNNVRTMMSVMTRAIRRLMFVNADRLNEEDAMKLLDGFGPNLVEVFRFNGGDAREIIQQIQSGGLPGELLAYAEHIEQEVREVTGQGRMDRGERINVESAEEAAHVQRGSDTQKGRNQAAFEDFWRSIIRKFGQGVRTVMTEEQIIPIIGPEDTAQLLRAQGINGQPAEPFIPVTPEQIQADYLFDIQVGSTLPRNNAQEIAEATAWLEIAKEFGEAVNIPEGLKDLALVLNKDPSKALLTPDQIAATNEAVQNQPPTEGGGGGQGGISPIAIAGQQQG